MNPDLTLRKESNGRDITHTIMFTIMVKYIFLIVVPDLFAVDGAL